MLELVTLKSQLEGKAFSSIDERVALISSVLMTAGAEFVSYSDGSFMRRGGRIPYSGRPVLFIPRDFALPEEIENFIESFLNCVISHIDSKLYNDA